MSKRLVVAVVSVVSLAAVASAIASGGTISSVSESAKVQPNATKELTAKCDAGAQAVASGFKGVLKGNTSDFVITALYPLESRISGAEAKGAEVNLSSNDAAPRATTYGYCGSPSVTEAKKTIKVAAGGTKHVTAKCPSGRTPISGGFKGSYSTDDNTGTIATGSSRAGRGWTVEGVAATSDMAPPTPITAYAYCAKGSALKTRSKKVTLHVPTHKLKTTNVDVSCKPGERVVSGGFRTAVPASPVGGPLTLSSYRRSADTWRIASAVSSHDAKITAYAYCRKK